MGKFRNPKNRQQGSNAKTREFKKPGEERKGNRHKFKYLRAKLNIGNLRNRDLKGKLKYFMTLMLQEEEGTQET